MQHLRLSRFEPFARAEAVPTSRKHLVQVHGHRTGPLGEGISRGRQRAGRIDGDRDCSDARTKNALQTNVGQRLSRFGPDKCRKYLANSGDEFM